MFFNPRKKILKKYERTFSSVKSIKGILNFISEDYKTPLKQFDRTQDEDMLLFQYGVYDWGNGKKLEIDFVRQLMENEDSIIQIHITLKYNYKDEFEDIKSYSKWCSGIENIDSWKKEILSISLIEKYNEMDADSVEVFSENAE